MVYSIAYTLLLPVQVYALNVQRHSLPMLLTSCLAAEYCGVLLSLIHYAKFAVDGEGVNALRLVGSFIDTAAQVGTLYRYIGTANYQVDNSVFLVDSDN